RALHGRRRVSAVRPAGPRAVDSHVLRVAIIIALPWPGGFAPRTPDTLTLARSVRHRLRYSSMETAGVFRPSLVKKTPASTAPAPAALAGEMGSPSQIAATLIATIGTTLE